MLKGYKYNTLEKVCKELADKRSITIYNLSFEELLKKDKVKKNISQYIKNLSEDTQKSTSLLGSDKNFYFAYYGSKEDGELAEVFFAEDTKREIIIYRNLPTLNDYIFIKNKEEIESLKGEKRLKDFFEEKNLTKAIDIQDTPKNKPLYLFLDAILEK